MRKKLAILITTYNRPHLAKKCITSIQNLGECSDVPLICFVDRYRRDSDKALNEETIEVVKDLRSQNYLDEIVLREKNLGTALNVTSSVTEVLSEYESVFVVEDDLEFIKNSKNLLSIMRSMLNDEFTSFTTYCHTSFTKNFFYLSRFSSQTWFTSRENWNNFSLKTMSNTNLTPSQESKIKQSLGSDILRDFKSFKEGKLNTWAVPWNIFNFLNERKMVYPPKSFVHNHSHLESAERTKGIEFPYEIEGNLPTNLNYTKIISNKKYLWHFHPISRLNRRLRAIINK